MSIFDPSSSLLVLKLPIKWVLLFMLVIVISSRYWVIPSNLNLMIGKCIQYLQKQVYSTLSSNYKKTFSLIITIFITVALTNLTGLIPFMFTATAHMMFNLSICFPLWLSGVIWALKVSSNSFLAHLVPYGSPLVLSPFLVLVELISYLIRPFSLSVRLMANILAGHIIMSLIDSGVTFANMISIPYTLCLSFFLMFEVMVALVQAFVVTNLMYLYWEESYGDS
nr:ATP synthase 6 [Lepidophthirus macrorhini]